MAALLGASRVGDAQSGANGFSAYVFNDPGPGLTMKYGIRVHPFALLFSCGRLNRAGDHEDQSQEHKKARHLDSNLDRSKWAKIADSTELQVSFKFRASFPM